METSANAVRFFGPFDFMNPAEIGHSMRYIPSLSALRSGPSCGTGCAYSLIMLNRTENMNAQNIPLPIIPAVDFKAEVLESQQPVLVEFWAPWSRPCQVLDRK